MKAREEDIDIEVYRNTQGMNDVQIARLKEITGTVNFRQYAKRSKTGMKKLIKKVAKNVKKHKYETPEQAGDRGWVMPTQKKGKKKAVKGKKKEADKMTFPEVKVTKGKKKLGPKIPRKLKEKIKQQKLRAPSGREYSQYEIHESVGSKRARDYRIRHGIPENDYEL